MSAEDLERYETEIELGLYREYRDVVGPVLLRRGDRAPVLPHQLRRRAGAHQRRRRGVLRGAHDRRLGVGHVPPGPVREERARAHLQGRQRRGARQARAPGPRRRADPELRPQRPGRSARRPQDRSPYDGARGRAPSARSAPAGAPRAAVGRRVQWAGQRRTVRAKDALGRLRRGASPPATSSRRRASSCSSATGAATTGEIDIVARDGDVLVVCEVKTRSSLRHGSPFEAVTERKLHRLERLGMRWMRERGVRPTVDARRRRLGAAPAERPSRDRARAGAVVSGVARTRGVVLLGVDGHVIGVEAHVSIGVSGFSVVGPGRQARGGGPRPVPVRRPQHRPRVARAQEHRRASRRPSCPSAARRSTSRSRWRCSRRAARCPPTSSAELVVVGELGLDGRVRAGARRARRGARRASRPAPRRLVVPARQRRRGGARAGHRRRTACAPSPGSSRSCAATTCPTSSCYADADDLGAGADRARGARPRRRARPARRPQRPRARGRGRPPPRDDRACPASARRCSPSGCPGCCRRSTSRRRSR